MDSLSKFVDFVDVKGIVKQDDVGKAAFRQRAAIGKSDALRCVGGHHFRKADEIGAGDGGEIA